MNQEASHVWDLPQVPNLDKGFEIKIELRR